MINSKFVFSNKRFCYCTNFFLKERRKQIDQKCKLPYCRPSFISCASNNNCAKFVNLSTEKNSNIAKLRFWTVHTLVKIVHAQNLSTVKSYNLQCFIIFRKWLENVRGQEAVSLAQKNQLISTEEFLAFIEMRLFITIFHS